MIETVVSWTELPNLHPALVHFPIAFAVLAVLFDLGATIRGRREWLDRAAVTTWIAAGVGAWGTWWAGTRAADSLTIPPTVQGHLNSHADWGLYTLWAIGGLAILRLAATLWRPAPHGGRVWVGAFLVLGLGAASVVLRTADLGGGLVYRHGLAVASEARGKAAPEDRRDESGEPERHAGGEAAPAIAVHEDGSRSWRPDPADPDAPEALGSVLTALGGGQPAGLTAAPGEGGLRLEIDGSGFALLAEPCGDAQVEADLSFRSFEGSFGVAHHVREDGSGGLFTVSVPEAIASLAIREGDDLATLDSAKAAVGAGSVTVAVSGAGRHFRGLVDGELVTHGHRAVLPDGRCGLYYDGSGAVLLEELRVFPVG